MILLDMSLPDSDAKDTFRNIKSYIGSIPVIILTGLEDLQTSVDLVHQGAEEYICKSDLNPSYLARSIINTIERSQIKTQLNDQLNMVKSQVEIHNYFLKESNVEDVMTKSIEKMSKLLKAPLYAFFKPINQHFELVCSNLQQEGLDRATKWAEQTFLKLCCTGNNEVGNSFTLVDLPEDINSIESGALRFKGQSISQQLVFSVPDGKSNSCYGVFCFYYDEHKIINSYEKNYLNALSRSLSFGVENILYEKQLRQKVRELNETHLRKDEFLATISHELKTPLNTIVGYLEIMKTKKMPEKELLGYVDIVQSNAFLEAKLVTELVDISKIVTGKFILDPSFFSLSDWLEDLKKSFVTSVNAKNIDLVFTLSISDKIANDSFYGDPNKLRQVMWNLISNAIKYTPIGGTIKVNFKLMDGFLEIQVQDTGKGISSEDLPHVFEKFWQSKSSFFDTQASMGLGLSIAKQIVELHGGEISVVSDGKNSGSTFTVNLPLQEGMRHSENYYTKFVKDIKKPTKHLDANKKVKKIRKLLKDKTILVIDDDLASGKILEVLLGQEGANVIYISDPKQALTYIKSTHLDCIISDISMPELNGYELIKCVRDWEKQTGKELTPAIALTAYSGSELKHQALQSGFYDCKEKPFVRDDLLNAVCSIL